MKVSRELPQTRDLKSFDRSNDDMQITYLSAKHILRWSKLYIWLDKYEQQDPMGKLVKSYHSMCMAFDPFPNIQNRRVLELLREAGKRAERSRSRERCCSTTESGGWAEGEERGGHGGRAGQNKRMIYFMLKANHT